MESQTFFNALALSAFLLWVLHIFINKNVTEMATKEDFQNLQSDMNKDLQNVRGDVSGLKSKIEELEKKVTDVLANAGMSADEEQEILDGFKAVKDDISGLAGETPDAEQPEEPEA